MELVRHLGVTSGDIKDHIVLTQDHEIAMALLVVAMLQQYGLAADFDLVEQALVFTIPGKDGQEDIRMNEDDIESLLDLLRTGERPAPSYQLSLTDAQTKIFSQIMQYIADGGIESIADEADVALAAKHMAKILGGQLNNLQDATNETTQQLQARLLQSQRPNLAFFSHRRQQVTHISGAEGAAGEEVRYRIRSTDDPNIRTHTADGVAI